MRLSWRPVVVVAALLGFVGLCSGCIFCLQPYSRFSRTFDLGGGRTLRVYSEGGAHGGWLDDDCPEVLYEITDSGRVIAGPRYLGNDRGGEYRFDVVFAGGGNLACVFEADRYREDPSYILLFDAATGESWPAVEQDTQEEVRRKWRDRYKQICAENPGLDFPAGFK